MARTPRRLRPFLAIRGDPCRSSRTVCSSKGSIIIIIIFGATLRGTGSRSLRHCISATRVPSLGRQATQACRRDATEGTGEKKRGTEGDDAEPGSDV